MNSNLSLSHFYLAVFVGQSSKLFRAKSKRLKLTKRTRQGETICLGFRIRPSSADFPPAGGVWGGMRAGFGTLFSKTNFEFCFSKCVAKQLSKN